MKPCTPSLSSGFPALDAELPQAGWPVGALTEILVPRVGHGELNVLGPLLQRLTRAGRTVVLLVPPYLSYAPALIQHGVALECVKVVRTSRPLDDGLGQIEPALQEGRFGALVALLPPDRDAQSENMARRLQMAARLAGCPAFLFHTCSTPDTTSASQLRLLADMTQPGRIRLQRIAPPAESGRGTVVIDTGPKETVRSAFRRVPAPSRASAPADASATSGPGCGHPGHGGGQPEERPGHSRSDPQTPRSKPVPGKRSAWPFKQRRTGGEHGGYSAALAMLFSRGWNA
ncbi:MAG: hypothetical protein QHC78_06955 [Pigmentiphaga sp.]|uniref:hypothetical protein n=1 Tax=Pigmentiphaga sp. TaxID=1977564 RepID=UPI0029AEE5FA|nr:hypothetical protein [Pigmentiphaga sp.]MDX3905410.1 hypothetical protein [Pigmentiphaga sp.]